MFFILTTLALAAATTSSPVKRAPPTDVEIMQFALTLENLENNFYTGALAKFDEAAFEADGLPPWARGRFVQLAEHEADHVTFLQNALGKDAVAPCAYSLYVVFFKFFWET